MTTTYLFGAGASVDAGVPATAALARQVYEAQHQGSALRRTLDVALGGLRQRQSVVKGDAFAEVDVEDLYATLLRLSDRSDDLLAPFVGTWSSAVAAVEAPDLSSTGKRVANALVRDLKEIQVKPSSSGKGVKLEFPTFGFRTFAQEIATMSQARPRAAFADAAKEVFNFILKKCDVKHLEAVAYYRRWLAASRAEPPWIATLNYDNCVELAAQHENMAIGLGVTDGTVRLSPESPGDQITLAKLHGSVDWHLSPEGKLVDEQDYTSRAILLGSEAKLRVQGPYLDLLFAFRERLEKTSRLEICGYSFRDEHINHFLARWWGPEKAVVIHDPADMRSLAAEIFPADEPKFKWVLRKPLSQRVTLDRHSAAEWMSSQAPASGTADAIEEEPAG